MAARRGELIAAGRAGRVPCGGPRARVGRARSLGGRRARAGRAGMVRAARGRPRARPRTGRRGAGRGGALARGLDAAARGCLPARPRADRGHRGRAASDRAPPARRPRRRPPFRAPARSRSRAARLAVAAFAYLAWRISTPIVGDALFHVGLMRRLGEAPSLSFANVSPFLHGPANAGYALPVLHAAFEGVAKLAGADPVVTFRYLLPPCAGLAIAAAYALARALTGWRAAGYLAAAMTAWDLCSLINGLVLQINQPPPFSLWVLTPGDAAALLARDPACTPGGARDRLVRRGHRVRPPDLRDPVPGDCRRDARRRLAGRASRPAGPARHADRDDRGRRRRRHLDLVGGDPGRASPPGAVARRRVRDPLRQGRRHVPVGAGVRARVRAACAPRDGVARPLPLDAARRRRHGGPARPPAPAGPEHAPHRCRRDGPVPPLLAAAALARHGRGGGVRARPSSSGGGRGPRRSSPPSASTRCAAPTGSGTGR